MMSLRRNYNFDFKNKKGSKGKHKFKLADILCFVSANRSPIIATAICPERLEKEEWHLRDRRKGKGKGKGK